MYTKTPKMPRVDPLSHALNTPGEKGAFARLKAERGREAMEAVKVGKSWRIRLPNGTYIGRYLTEAQARAGIAKWARVIDSYNQHSKG